MKNVSARIFSAILGLTMLVMAGCSINPSRTESENGTLRIECAAIVTGVTTDMTACAVDAQRIDPDTGKNTGKWGREVRLTTNASLAGEAVKGIVAGTGAAHIQGEAMKDAAEIGKCAEGANCGTLVYNQNIATGGQGGRGGSAGALAVSGASSNSSANITNPGGGTCSTCMFKPN